MFAIREAIDDANRLLPEEDIGGCGSAIGHVLVSNRGRKGSHVFFKQGRLAGEKAERIMASPHNADEARLGRSRDAHCFVAVEVIRSSFFNVGVPIGTRGKAN
jgi:hypothetical protein